MGRHLKEYHMFKRKLHASLTVWMVMVVITTQYPCTVIGLIVIFHDLDVGIKYVVKK